ncbi:hypothetical protein OUZ56_015928 [Daphnia magna]|uniref:Uncharacterized protein n=1 Tax=Daphnia magna TaxID=35525 RepID=A0ABR0AP54_9CRUS|nr:hypothetical protein OUZ56_015928 [Daphnia magna]
MQGPHKMNVLNSFLLGTRSSQFWQISFSVAGYAEKSRRIDERERDQKRLRNFREQRAKGGESPRALT